MGVCNSHKCHCPSCTAALKAVEEMTRCARERKQQQRLEQHFADALRREQWKRTARQHHIDQSGCCAGESECPCPNCREYREFYRLRSDENSHRVFIGHDDRGVVVKWIWVRRPGGWRRKDLKTNRIFGPFVQHVEPSAIWPVTSHHIRTRTAGGASIRDEVIVYTTEFYRADNYGWDSLWSVPPGKIEVTVTDECSVQRTTPEEKEITMLTPLHVAILAHFNVHPDVPYPYTCGMENVSQHIEGLVTAEFLARSLDAPYYQLTTRARTFLRAVETLPLPIRKPAPWVMPD